MFRGIIENIKQVAALSPIEYRKLTYLREQALYLCDSWDRSNKRFSFKCWTTCCALQIAYEYILSTFLAIFLTYKCFTSVGFYGRETQTGVAQYWRREQRTGLSAEFTDGEGLEIGKISTAKMSKGNNGNVLRFQMSRGRDEVI